MCFLLECRVLTVAQVKEVHRAITDFCRLDEQIYGSTQRLLFTALSFTRMCLRLWAYPWILVFAYERFNGVLGQEHTNNRVPESTLMQMWLVTLELHDRVQSFTRNIIPAPLRKLLDTLKTSWRYSSRLHVLRPVLPCCSMGRV